MSKSIRPTLLVGSVNLESAEAVFSTAGDILGDSLRSVPDGETGIRLGWFQWQTHVMARAPFLQKASVQDPTVNTRDMSELGQYRVRGDLSGARFDKLGYADAAIDSYKVFAGLRAKGKIPADVRFQVSLPTPLAPMTVMIEPQDYLKVEPIYEEAMRREIEVMCEAIPAKDLAIQWDVASELAILEGVIMEELAGTVMQDGAGAFSNPKQDIVTRLGRVMSWVPENVALGLHFCYGDMDHKHFKEPKDMGVMVDLANAIFAAAPRRIDWIHMPVPRDRDDEAYFAPLKDLKKPSATQLYLGLVHHTDGLEGGKRRMNAAKRYMSDFGVATECGLGRRPTETIPDVMKQMAALAAG